MKKMLSVFLVTSLMAGLGTCGSKTADAGKAKPAKTEAKAQLGKEKKETEEKKESGEKRGSGDSTVVVYSVYSLEFLDPLVGEFEKETGVKVDLITAGTGGLLRRIESGTSNPLGDILFVGTVPTVASQTYLFKNYISPNEEFVISEEHKSVGESITRATLMPSVSIVNIDLVGDLEINGYEDLLSPELKGEIAAANPAQTVSGWEHLVNMLCTMGGRDTDEAWNFVEKLCENLDDKLLSNSSTVYKGVVDGEYTTGLTYETGGADCVVAGAPMKLVYMEEGVIFRGTNICIVKDAPRMGNAQKFVNSIARKRAQTMMVVGLSNQGIHNGLPDSPILKPYSEVNVIGDDESIATDNKTNWIEYFTDIYTNVQ